MDLPVQDKNFLTVPDAGWFTSSIRTGVRKRSPSPKRKVGVYMYMDHGGYVDGVEPDRDDDRRISRGKIEKLDEQTKRAIAKTREALDVDSLLEKCLGFLCNRDLTWVAPVSKAWLNASTRIRRQRMSNSPFVLMWRDPKLEDEEDQLAEKFSLHFRKSWFEGFGTVQPVGTIISMGTTCFTLGTVDFLGVPAITEGNVNFIYAAGGHMTSTVSEDTARRFVNFNDSTCFALQTLCIPQNPNIDFLSIAVPIWSDATKMTICSTLANTHFSRRNSLIHGYGKGFKGMLVFLHFEDGLTREFAEAYALGAQVRDVNDLGMIIANVDGVGSSESTKRGSVASILAIHGSDSVRLAAYGFQMTPESLFHFGNIARSFLFGAQNKFVLMVYKFRQGTANSLLGLKEAIGDIPMIGLETYTPIGFHGYRLGRLTSNDDIEVALFLVKY